MKFGNDKIKKKTGVFGTTDSSSIYQANNETIISKNHDVSLPSINGSNQK